MKITFVGGGNMARAIARGVFEANSLPHEGAQASWRDRYG